MRTGLVYGVLLAFLMLSGISWADGGAVVPGAGLDTIAVESAAKYGPLAVAIVLFGVQVGRSLTTAIRDATSALQQGRIVFSVKLDCPHLGHLAEIQRHMDRDQAQAEVRAEETARRLSALEAAGASHR
jgi:hypothetical protein